MWDDIHDYHDDKFIAIYIYIKTAAWRERLRKPTNFDRARLAEESE